MPITVRPVRDGDAPGCARIWRDAAAFFTTIDPALFQVPDEQGLIAWFAGIHARLASDPTRLLLVADVDGDLVGSLAATLHEPVDSAARQVRTDLAHRRVHVDALAVAGTHRRRGVGTALMRDAERWARERDALVITLETELSNPSAMPFYEQRLGYRRQSVTFRRDLRPDSIG